MPFMPLDVNRLRDSDLAITSTGDEFKAAVLLWCAAWNQSPAASLPQDDLSLSAYAGYGPDVRRWKRVKAGALRGFVLCSDGRYYHPVIAIKALEAWAERLEFREMKQNERERKERERRDRAEIFAKLREKGHVLPHTTPTGRLRELLASLEPEPPKGHPPVTVTGHADGTAKTGIGKGQGQGEGQGRELFKASATNNTSADTSTGPAAELARALRSMGWSECADGHPELQAAAAQGITAQHIQAAAAGKGGKSISYIVARARGMRDDAASGSTTGTTPNNVVPINPAEAQIAAERRRLEDQVYMAENDLRLGLITAEVRNERVAELQAELASLASAGESRS
ncbi:DUF1376 domain-containing protein [Xanthomonas sp. LMG 8992]|nr:DUF1376 domain-containing protein [Xanthomonas sp. LMG 8992]